MGNRSKLTLEIEMLGPLQVRVREVAAEFRTDAERVLLAYLAAHQGIPQRRDTLAGLLSPDRPDTEALTYLRNRLTRLRSALGDDEATPPWFDVDRKQITLRAGDDIVIDVTRFEQHLATVERHAHRQLAESLLAKKRLPRRKRLLRQNKLPPTVSHHRIPMGTLACIPRWRWTTTAIPSSATETGTIIP